VELESALYDRDSLIYDALQGGGGGALQNVMKKKNKGKKGAAAVGGADVMQQMGKPKGFLAGLFGKQVDTMYRAKIMNPSDRKRGANRSDYIKGLLDNVQDVLKNTEATGTKKTDD
jgi:hypothetical protein